MKRRFSVNPKTNFTQGFYKIKNPDKYTGKKTPIYRSSWELSYMIYCDMSSNILKWGSEEIAILYYDPIRFRKRRYYPDFIVMTRDKKKQLIEIKPSRETKPPRNTKKKKRMTFIYEQVTYRTNLAKWAAAEKYCEKKGWEFVKITEKELRHINKSK